MSTPQSIAFVPLAASSASNGRDHEFRVLVAERPELARPLRELTTSPSSSAEARPGSAARCEPKVTLHQEGGHISGIHIQCSCGQVIELQCAY